MITGEVLKEISAPDPAAASDTACAAACVTDAHCGGWTSRAAHCRLMKQGARVLANVGSGCGALGHSGCTSGIVGWQLEVPGTEARIGVLLPLTGESERLQEEGGAGANFY